MINDYADVDTDIIFGQGSIAQGIISKNKLLVLSLVCLIISYAISLYFHSIKAFSFLLFMTVLSYSYSVEPFRLKKKSILGFPVVVFAAGPAGLIYTYIEFGFSDYLWVVGMGVISFLHIGQTQVWGGLYDFEADKKVGIVKRPVQILGKKKSFRLLAWLELAIFLVLLSFFIYYYKVIPFIFLLIVFIIYFFIKMKLIRLKDDNKKYYQKFMWLSFPRFTQIIAVSLLIFSLL